MPDVLMLACVVMAATLVVGLVPMVRSTSSVERMLTAQLLGTNGVGLILLLAQILDMPALVDVALVLALLAVIAVVAFTRRSGGSERA
ncbi:MAG: monovalent cation/H+ antiporter complex subunit F [Arenicellales bacterium]|nr:monovalent cation/H+ antiporter complex subunit F [Arenicellales bacterium]